MLASQPNLGHIAAEKSAQPSPSRARLSSPPANPDASSTIRDVVVKLRRAQLARIVKGVVVASVILCVAAIASAVVRATTKGDGAEDSPPRAAMKAREAGPMAAVITMRESIDALSDRTRTALAREQRRSAAHAMTASRGRSFW